MRPNPGLLFSVIAMAAAGSACAEAPTPIAGPVTPSHSPLNPAAFVPPPISASAVKFQADLAKLPAIRVQAGAADAGAAPFILPTVALSPLDSPGLAQGPRPVAGQGMAFWRDSQLTLAPTGGGAVDMVRLSLGELARAPGGIYLGQPGGLMPAEAQAFDLSYVRGWPAALTVSKGAYDLDFSPHAGLGWSSGGGSAEAGGMIRLGGRLQQGVIQRLNGMGVREVDPSVFDHGRWFLFAAASGRAVGLNMTRDGQGALQRVGWSSEGTSAMISDAQAGFGWRRGPLQASIGYVHREIKTDLPENMGRDPQSLRDSMLAFSFTIAPR